jgi:hypothetical protein
MFQMLEKLDVHCLSAENSLETEQENGNTHETSLKAAVRLKTVKQK